MNLVEALKDNDPDSEATIQLDVAVPKNNPLLTVLDCFANEDVSLRIQRADEGERWKYTFLITGTLINLNLVDLRIEEWRQTYAIPPLPES